MENMIGRVRERKEDVERERWGGGGRKWSRGRGGEGGGEGEWRGERKGWCVVREAGRRGR